MKPYGFERSLQSMPEQNQRLDELKKKYAAVLSAIPQLGIRLSHVHVQDDKLFIQGEAPSDEAKNKLWDRIKLEDPYYEKDLTADITVSETAASQAASKTGSVAAGVLQTYTVQPGDTLSMISQEVYGAAGQYMKIFEANKDQLKDPNKIQTGQILKIPK